MRITLSLLFLLISITPVFSQKNLVYKGVVKDANTQESIPYATVAIYNNTNLIDGVSTNNDGEFQLKSNKDATHIEVSFIGYKTYILQISTITDANAIAINLQSSNELDEVVIQAERTTTQLKIDRKIINLGADLQQSGTTTLEAFDQISEIQTDLGMGTISLRGSGNVRVLVNGKPSPLNTTDLLQQIAASSVDKIEIITSPSAKNQADGISGIINIILKKNVDYGLNLAVNSSVGTKRHQYGFDANYNLSSVNIRLNASNGIRNMDSRQWIYQQYTNGNTRDFFAPHDFNGKIKSISSGIDFFLNKNNELSFQVDYTNNFHSFYNDTFYTNVTGRPDYMYTRNSSHTHKTTVYNANYRKKFATEGHYLELDYNLTNNENILPASDTEEGVFLFDEFQKNQNDLHAFGFDYTLPMKKMTLETGFSWNYRGLRSYRMFTPNVGVATQDVFNYKENLIGIYSLVKFISGKFNWQAGVRYEDFTSDSNNTANNEVSDLQFKNLFPSVHLSYASNDKNTFSTGYSKRISRPNFRHINPFRMGNQYFQWNSNPNLQPEFADNFEFNYQYNGEKLNLSASTFYRYRTDVIQWLETIDADGVRLVNFDNVGERNSFGIESTIQYKMNRYWNAQLSANYYYTKANQPNITWDHIYNSTIILKNTIKITKNVSTDITYRHTPRDQNIYSITAPRNRFDWAIRASFLENKLTANFRIVDVLDDNLRRRTIVLPGITQQEVWEFQSQSFGWMLSINYKLFQNKGKTRNRKTRDYNQGRSTN